MRNWERKEGVERLRKKSKAKNNSHESEKKAVRRLERCCWVFRSKSPKVRSPKPTLKIYCEPKSESTH